VPAAELDAASALLFGDSFSGLLLAPNTTAGRLSALRFPDSALCEVASYLNPWAALTTQAGVELRRSLSLAFPTKIKHASPPAAAGDWVRLDITFVLSLLSKDGAPYTALRLNDFAAGTEHILFSRYGDMTAHRAVEAARALPPAAEPRMALAGVGMRASLVPGQEVLLRPADAPSGAVAGAFVATFSHLSPPPGEEAQAWGSGGERRWRLAPEATPPPASAAAGWACVLLTSGGLREPLRLLVPLADIRRRHSLYSLLFSDGGGGARWAIPAPGDPPLLPCSLDAARAAHAALRPPPTPSQRSVFAAVASRRLSTVWGPPGSGKTHWAAGALVTLLRLHGQTAGAPPLRVLVTAQSWEALRLLYRRVLAGLDDYKAEAWAARLLESGCWDLKDSAPGPIDLWGQPLALVAGTVWKAAAALGPWEKRAAPGGALCPRGRPPPGAEGPLRPMPKFDLVFVDEASQLPAADAVMVLDLLDPGRGRLVAMGDHLQLPYVQHGSYPEPPGDEAGRPRPWHSLLDALRAALGGGAEAAAHRDACVLLDNHRMCLTLAELCRQPGGIYPPRFQPCDAAGREDACGCRAAKQPTRCSAGDEQGGLLRLRVDASDPARWPALALAPAHRLVTVRVPSPPEADTRAPAATEADLAATLIERALRWLMPPDGEAWSVVQRCEALIEATLVVAPHHRQRADLRRALRERLPKAEADALLAESGGLLISTVEKVQGQERDLVIIMYGLVDGAAIASEAAFLYSQPRLNVALTRARKKAVLLLTRACESPELDSGALTLAVQAGAALLARVARLCRQGSEAEAAGAAALAALSQPAASARYVRTVLVQGDGLAGLSSEVEAMKLVSQGPSATPPPPGPMHEPLAAIASDADEEDPDATQQEDVMEEPQAAEVEDEEEEEGRGGEAVDTDDDCIITGEYSTPQAAPPPPSRAPATWQGRGGAAAEPPSRGVASEPPARRQAEQPRAADHAPPVRSLYGSLDLHPTGAPRKR